VCQQTGIEGSTITPRGKSAQEARVQGLSESRGKKLGSKQRRKVVYQRGEPAGGKRPIRRKKLEGSEAGKKRGVPGGKPNAGSPMNVKQQSGRRKKPSHKTHPRHGGRREKHKKPSREGNVPRDHLTKDKTKSAPEGGRNAH